MSLADLFDEAAAEAQLRVREREDADRLGQEASELTSSIGQFIAGAWVTVEPVPFVANWHIDAICEHLEAAYKGDILRLLINIPPRCMKSLTVSVFGPAYVWAKQPEKRILNASYAHALAVRDSAKSRRIIQSPWYQLRWGNGFRLADDENLKQRYENDRGGLRLATSVGGSTTGEGGDILIVDDPLKAEDAQSDAMRGEVNEWWGSTWATRLNDLATGVKIVIMQRLHEDDLTGHILAQEGTVADGGEWTHLCLPMEYEPSHPFVWPDDPRQENGDLLWPKHVTDVGVAKLKTSMGSFVQAGQLQQRPAPAEGGLIKRQWWRYYDQLTWPDFTHVVQSWDTALKAKTTSDWTVGQLWGALGPNRYLIRELRGRWDLTETITQALALHQWTEDRFGHLAHAVVVENTANGPEVIVALRTRVPGIKKVNARGDKTQRASAVSPIIEAGNVFLPGRLAADALGPDTGLTPLWVQEFVDEHSAFPNASFDDRVDAMSQALQELRGAGRPVRERDTDEDRPKAMTAGLLTRDL